MNLVKIISILVSISICHTVVFAQNVTLFEQHNGKIDFTFIGNTLNTHENGANDACDILTSSSANLNLSANDVIKNAYLYWAGSGTGDFNVKLNNTNITSQRSFSLTLATSGLPFFGCFANITPLVQQTGNANYTLSELDISAVLNPAEYCNNGTNFAGWAILVIYENSNLPINQINVYDGLQNVPQQLSITLNNLNVIDNNGAKIGFIAWEGDKNIQVNETLRLNGNVLSNPPLNPANNAFNGTNSSTLQTDLYNMDLDIYDIQNNIQIGDTSAQIELTSGQDFVMINTVVTKLNSQLPDATVQINQVNQSCDSTNYTIAYTIKNQNCTAVLPANTPIAFYVNNQLVGQTTTPQIIPINGIWNSQFVVTCTVTIFDLKIVVDDNGNSQSTVIEIFETNNSTQQNITSWQTPTLNSLPNIETCMAKNSVSVFDFSAYQNLVLQNNTDSFVGFFETLLDAQNNTNAITNTTAYSSLQLPKEIFVKVANSHCSRIISFVLSEKDCSIVIPSVITPNDDGINDTFFIANLRDLYPNYIIQIYNRWGFLVWEGTKDSDNWKGETNQGISFLSKKLPESTYYYKINYNHNQLKPSIGWVYIKL